MNQTGRTPRGTGAPNRQAGRDRKRHTNRGSRGRRGTTRTKKTDPTRTKERKKWSRTPPSGEKERGETQHKLRAREWDTPQDRNTRPNPPRGQPWRTRGEVQPRAHREPPPHQAQAHCHHRMDTGDLQPQAPRGGGGHQPPVPRPTFLTFTARRGSGLAWWLTEAPSATPERRTSWYAPRTTSSSRSAC